MLKPNFLKPNHMEKDTKTEKKPTEGAPKKVAQAKPAKTKESKEAKVAAPENNGSIHPEYFADAVITCACGNKIKVGSVKKEISARCSCSFTYSFSHDSISKKAIFIFSIL